jgi:YD repeat-containing protein
VIKPMAFRTVAFLLAIGCGNRTGQPTVSEPLPGKPELPSVLASCGNGKLDPPEECDSDERVELFSVPTGCVRCRWDIGSPPLAKEVITDLYKQDITLTATSRVMRSRGDDGHVYQVHQFTYDQQGNCTRETQDNDNDGQFEVELDRRFDGNGNATYESRKSVMGDTEVTTRTYDARARITSETHEEGKERTETHWEYGAGGALDTRWVDDNRDGVADFKLKLTYDANGRKRLAVVTRRDQPAATQQQYDYDAQGLLIAERTDSDGDGTWETTKRNEYDPAGQLRVSVVQSENSEVRTGYEYDASGHVVRHVVHSGFGDEETTGEYDDRGNLVRSKTTEGGIVRRDEQFRYDQPAADAWRRRIKDLLVARQVRQQALNR